MGLKLVLLFVFISLSYAQWTELALDNTTHPNNRGRGVSFLDAENNFWFYGGRNALLTQAAGCYGDVWKFNGTYWQHMEGPSVSFEPVYDLGNLTAGARYSSAYWTDSKGVTWIYGGSHVFVTVSGGYTIINTLGYADMWKLDVSSGTVNWEYVSGYKGVSNKVDVDFGDQGVASTNSTPGSREDMASWIDTNDNLWLFGGYLTNNGTGRSDLWMFNTTSLLWTFIGGPKTSGEGGNFTVKGKPSPLNWPPGHFASAAWTIKNQFWLLGGASQSFLSGDNDLWNYENGLWTWVSGHDDELQCNENRGVLSADCSMSLRAYSTGWVYKDVLYLFGGVSYEPLQDVWAFDIKLGIWGWIGGARGKPFDQGMPPGRGAAAIVTRGDHAYFYGGWILYDYYGDLWSMDLANFTYTVKDSSQASSSSSVLAALISNHSTAIAVGIVVPIVFLAGIVAGYFIWKKKFRAQRFNDIEVATVAIPMTDRKRRTAKIETLNGVTIGELIGVGSYSEVFKGDWLGTPVALKKLKSLNDIEEFRKEAKMLVTLKHTCIVQYFGTYIDQNSGSAFLVTELMFKGDAKNMVREHKASLNSSDILSMALSAAAGMVYLHENNIIHSDIALRNLLVSTTDRIYSVKVSDFGMARVLGETGYYTSESKVMPYKWCSPEVLKYGKFSYSSDVWAFGVLLWELYTFGEEPYQGLSNSEASEQVLRGLRLPQPKECPAKIYEIMTKCWTVPAKERPSMKEVHNMLNEDNKSTQKSFLFANNNNAEPVYHM